MAARFADCGKLWRCDHAAPNSHPELERASFKNGKCATTLYFVRRSSHRNEDGTLYSGRLAYRNQESTAESKAKQNKTKQTKAKQSKASTLLISAWREEEEEELPIEARMEQLLVGIKGRRKPFVVVVATLDESGAHSSEEKAYKSRLREDLGRVAVFGQDLKFMGAAHLDLE